MQGGSGNAHAGKPAGAGGLLERCTLVHGGHETMAEHVAPGVRAVMFNLGWLPGGDKRVTTRVHTTLAALEAALSLIAPGGIVTVCIYPGHEEGNRERDALGAADRRAGRSGLQRPAPSLQSRRPTRRSCT